jgi:hypothetical protein
MRAAVLAALLPLAGCATLMHGPTQQVNIQTIPPGAECRVSGLVITAPGVVQLSREEDVQQIVCEMPGYQAAGAAVRRATSPALVGNIFFGIVPGLVVDFMTGAAGELEPGVVLLRLDRSPDRKTANE